MGAACGKGHTLNEEDAPYETKGSLKKPVSPDRQKDDDAAEVIEENVVVQESKGDLKSEVKSSAIKVQFPEHQDIKKYIDPETSETCFVNEIESATVVAQKSSFYIPSVFHYTYGLSCCSCKLSLNESCTVIFGFTYHQSPRCLCCSVCNAPLTGIKKKSDITISSNGQLFCAECSVKDAPLVCAASHEEINEEDLDFTEIAVGRRFKSNNLKCSICQLPLSNTKIFKDEKLFCGNCYTENVAPTCHQTGRKIVGRALKVGEEVYQIDAVKCPKCGFKMCDNESVYLVQGQPPVHMDCSKSVSSEFYKITTDDEALFSAFEDNGSDSDRGGHMSDSRKQKRTDFSYSSINTSFSSLPFSRVDRPETIIPPVYRLKNANQYMGSYLKPERDTKTKPGSVSLGSQNGTVHSNGTKAVFNSTIGIDKKSTTRPMQNGSTVKTTNNRASTGLGTPRKIDSHDYSGPLAPVYYKKERERRRQEKIRMNKSEILNSSSKPAGGTMSNGHSSFLNSTAEREQQSSLMYDGDISVSNRLTSVESSTNSSVPDRKLAFDIGSDNETDTTVQASTRVADSSDTEYETDNYANGDVGGMNGQTMNKDSPIEDSEAEGRGYVTEDEIDRMQSGLGKEILRELKMQIDTNATKDDVEALYVPDDPIKASRSPDAKTEVQLPYFCEIKFGPIATGINRYCDTWLLEQAINEPMGMNDYNNFMQGFQRFTNASAHPWKHNSTSNSLVDGAMSDTEGMRRFKYSDMTSSRGKFRMDGYKSEGGYNSSPEMGRRKMTRYNSLDVRKAWYHERFLTYVQMYHKKGNLLFEQQKEACMQHIRMSVGSLSRSENVKVYPKEKLFTNMNKRLPEDVNRSRLELHLSDEEFVDLFAMTHDQFRSLPPWKQNVMKQLNYLF